MTGVYGRTMGKRSLPRYFQAEFSPRRVENLKLFHSGNFIKTLNETRRPEWHIALTY